MCKIKRSDVKVNVIIKLYLSENHQGLKYSEDQVDLVAPKV